MHLGRNKTVDSSIFKGARLRTNQPGRKFIQWWMTSVREKASVSIIRAFFFFKCWIVILGVLSLLLSSNKLV